MPDLPPYTHEPAPEGGGLLRVRLDLAYDGRQFAGWAPQPGQRTVCGELATAVQRVLRVDDIRIVVAGVNGDRERWTFDSVDPADRSTVDTVHLGGATPSSVTFTVAPLGPAPAERLPCPAAAKPCRPWIPAGNGG